ncbi:MAG TPA: hypothetical protein VM492_07640 [Sumerlaeia bacterium]|nr:hypothetical protein [Sumerlaeia bacterium]
MEGAQPKCPAKLSKTALRRNCLASERPKARSRIPPDGNAEGIDEILFGLDAEADPVGQDEAR